MRTIELNEDDMAICKTIGVHEMTLEAIIKSVALHSSKVKPCLDRLVRNYSIVQFRDRKSHSKFPVVKYKLGPRVFAFLCEIGEIDVSKGKAKSYPSTNFMKLLEKA